MAFPELPTGNPPTAFCLFKNIKVFSLLIFILIDKSGFVKFTEILFLSASIPFQTAEPTFIPTSFEEKSKPFSTLSAKIPKSLIFLFSISFFAKFIASSEIFSKVDSVKYAR
jgi:hypothetical protein